MTFDFALWSEGQVPVTLVCEEAHRYVPTNPSFGFEPCKRAIAKIDREGRKYGASLCIVTQRPAEIDPAILSQGNTVFALRMSNDRDQEIVKSAIADTGAGLLEFLSALGQREAIAFGDGVTLPVRIKFDELPAHAMPRSSSARVTEMWQKSVGDEGFLDSDRRSLAQRLGGGCRRGTERIHVCRKRQPAGERFRAARPGRLRGPAPAPALAREPW
jgi:DNA helicase HerA-like ATPase